MLQDRFPTKYEEQGTCSVFCYWSSKVSQHGGEARGREVQQVAFAAESAAALVPKGCEGLRGDDG